MLVHFLKSDQIRLNARHDLTLTCQIDEAVGAFTVVNVAGQHAQRSRERSGLVPSCQNHSRDRETQDDSV